MSVSDRTNKGKKQPKQLQDEMHELRNPRQRKNHERTKAQAYTDTLWFKLVVSYFAFQYAGVEIILYKKTEPIVSKELGEKLPPSAPSLEKYFNAEETSVFGRYNMPTSFVLINTEIGFETDVLNELKKVEGVDEASAVYGVYDIVARVKADTMDRLKEIITWRIRRLDKVRSTLTMIVVEEKV